MLAINSDQCLAHSSPSKNVTYFNFFFFFKLSEQLG